MAREISQIRSSHKKFYTKMVKFAAAIVAVLAAGANAFVPSSFGVRTATNLYADAFVRGKYDDKTFDNAAKKEIYDEWDPTKPRDGMNFNPFETFGGNSPDASGKFPGQTFYKDPARGVINYETMLIEKEEKAARDASPKAGDEPGAPGRVV